MNLPELNRFIKRQKMQGSSNLDEILIEKHKRFPFLFNIYSDPYRSICIFRKVKGGIGMQIGIGLLISFPIFSFCSFRHSSPYRVHLAPCCSLIPNVLFAIIAIFLYRMAPK